MSETVQPTAPVKLPSRFFYRCADCLSVVATETKIPTVYNPKHGHDELTAVCDACGGHIEYMGETVRTRQNKEYALRKVTGYRPVCDGKCVNATGPNCECECGGENHGTGRIVEVYEQSGVPHIKVPADAVMKAEEFRRLVAEFKAAYDKKWGYVNDMKRAGEWISNWSFFMDGQYMWGSYLKARAMRSHKGRNRRIQELTAECLK